MLPSLTAVARRRPERRAILAAIGALLLTVAVLASQLSPAPQAAAAPVTVAEGLAPGTWAVSIPTSWLISPIAGLRAGDRLDILALRPGEHAIATAVAFDLVVVSADDRAVIVGTGADDATALAVARASGLLLVPLLRSTR